MTWKPTPEKQREYNRAHYWRNKEKENLRSKKWREANLELAKEIARAWREKNRGYHKVWNQENRDKLREADKRWSKAHPEKVAIKARRRRAAKRNAGGEHTKEDINKIIKLQSNRCAYCRKRLKSKGYHVDHITPLAKGGSNGKTNLQVLCAPCNLSKNDQDPILFAQSIGFML